MKTHPERQSVLVLCTNSDEAGAPIHVETLILGLRHKIEFVAVFGEEGPVACRLRSAGVRVFIIPEMRSKISPIADCRAYLKLASIIRMSKPDLIHAHSAKAGMLGRLGSLLHAVPVLYTVHGWGWRGLPKASARAIWLIEKILSFTPRSHYLFVAKSVYAEGHTSLGLPDLRSQVIYNGVKDVGFAAEPSGPLRILMVARVTLAKDHETAVKAFERLPQNSCLILCGSGTDSPEFERLVRSWAPSAFPRIKLLGQRADVPALLQDCNVFALISKFEALPLSIIEAMSAARAVVATDVGGVREIIIDKESGLVVPPGDVQGVYEAFSQLAQQEARALLAEHARTRYLQYFHAERMTDQVAEYYRKIIGTNHAQRN